MLLVRFMPNIQAKLLEKLTNTKVINDYAYSKKGGSDGTLLNDS